MRARCLASPNQGSSAVDPTASVPLSPVAVSDENLKTPSKDSIHKYFTQCPQLTFSAQNCNSLNISTECDKQLVTLISITALCTDIIFLSDLRLNKGTAQTEKSEKFLPAIVTRVMTFTLTRLSLSAA